MTERPRVAIFGSPNSGKTTLFNALTDSRARVGNYPGVTVEQRRALMHAGGHAIEMIDVPGTYSIVAHTAEEQIAVEAMLGIDGLDRPDLVVVCVDATKLVRGLYTVLQLQELGVPLVIALTMTDEAGDTCAPPERLAQVLGAPVVPVVAPRGVGLSALKTSIAEALVTANRELAPLWRWTPSPRLAEHIAKVRAAFPSSWPGSDALALWALMSVEDDDELRNIPAPVRAAVGEAAGDGVDIDNEAVVARYRWLDQQVEPLTRGRPLRRWTETLDRVLVHRVYGFAVFLGLMFIVFQSLFAWADPAITLIEDLFGFIGDTTAESLGPGLVTEFIVDGLIAGVGSVVVFLPQILLLFFFIGLMEDSGYMARVAYLMDRIMKSMNLHGRAFVPMLSGFACAVPAIMATRTLERRRDRLLTMMVVPLMTCSARLPIYTLIIAALFPAGHVLGIFPVQGLLLVGMYLFSVLMALIAAWVMSKTIKPLRAKRLPFVIELPPYRMPRGRDVLRMMWQRARLFLEEAGTVILACTVVLWALLSFPRSLPEGSPDLESRIEQAVSADDRAAAEAELAGALLRNSYAGRLGHAIEPAIEPLGFDWKIGIGIIGAFAAREVFVSTMGVVYSVGDDVDEGSATLRERIRSEKRAGGTAVYTPLVGLTLMIFFALACQCMSTLAVVKRETGGYRWPAFLFAYMTTLAWVVSLLVYQGGRLLGFE